MRRAVVKSSRWVLDSWWRKTVYVFGWVALVIFLLLIAFILTIVSAFFRYVI